MSFKFAGNWGPLYTRLEGPSLAIVENCAIGREARDGPSSFLPLDHEGVRDQSDSNGLKSMHGVLHSSKMENVSQLI